jgi:hypothetical protein
MGPKTDPPWTEQQIVTRSNGNNQTHNNNNDDNDSNDSNGSRERKTTEADLKLRDALELVPDGAVRTCE